MLQQLLNALPTLYAEKSAGVALVLGFLTGGIGLGLYLRSLVDFVVPIGLVVLLTTALHGADVGWLGGAIVAGIWGYLRVANSNERLVKKLPIAQ